MKLRRGQVLYIDNQKYTIINMIEYKETTWIWQEYEIVNEDKIHKWLSIELNEKYQEEYYIYEPYDKKINTNELEIYINNEKFDLYEKGTATVLDYYGNADVDLYETCEYFDYASNDLKTIISVEEWEGEIETSIGYYLPNEAVNITTQIDRTTADKNLEEQENKKIKKGVRIKKSPITWIMIVFIIIIILSILPLFSGLFQNKSIQKYLQEHQSKYTYVTSVTNNTNNEKAKVYKSSFLTLDETVKDVIDGVPEGITKTTDSDPNTRRRWNRITNRYRICICLRRRRTNIYTSINQKIFK